VNELVLDAIGRMRAAFESSADPERAGPMAAYMKHHFEFYGIPAPERRKLQRLAWAGLPKRMTEADIIALVDACWAEPRREFQYAGMELADNQIKHCSPAALAAVERWIHTKSWWDTVDDLCRHSAGELVRMYPELRIEMDRWSESGELWLIRSAILHEEMKSAQTDIDRLEAICLRHASHKDFFIRKAIGWALRSYAHQSPEQAARVRTFLAAHDAVLSPLSKREALKRIKH
jgi:3-methyladenine DNA glycosylase AlkD